MRQSSAHKKTTCQGSAASCDFRSQAQPRVGARRTGDGMDSVFLGCWACCRSCRRVRTPKSWRYSTPCRRTTPRRRAWPPRRAFPRLFVRTFARYLAEARIVKACALLHESGKSVAEIAVETGFGSVSNFNRRSLALKRASPLRYRKNAGAS